MQRAKRPVVAAVLRVQRGCAESPDSSETIQLWGVTTDAAALNRGLSDVTATYNDLGGGALYGSTTVSTADGQSEWMRVKLSAKAVKDLNTLRGKDRYWSTGAALSTVTEDRGDQVVWGCTLEELRPTLRPAVYRNLLTYLYEQEHQLDTSLGRGQIDRVRPVARRYNLVRTHAPVAAVERRVDFDTGHEIAV